MAVVQSPSRTDGLRRLEAPDKVTGAAKYAYEYAIEDLAYAQLVLSTVARGRVGELRSEAALAVPGTIDVIWAENALRLHGEGELAVLQSREVAYRGQIVAIVVADSLEAARHAAGLLEVDIEPAEHDTALREDDPGLYAPEKVNPSYATDTDEGDFDTAYPAAAVQIDATYSTPYEHNNPMEPHASTATWAGDHLTIYDSTQGAAPARSTIAQTFGLEAEQVRVIAPHVGGGFGSKGTPRPTVIAAAMAAKLVGRPVKLAATRQQMFTLTGYRTPTIQRMRLGADADGRLTAIGHDVIEQTGKLQEFAEQTAVVTRMMYASRNRRTTHRLAALDVPTPSWMRAPGECPGMYALESAIDELAHAAGLDPIELRVRNEPEVDPESGHPFSSRNLVACLREGAQRFGWGERLPEPGTRWDGRWLIGLGVAASTYPARRRASQARAIREPDGSFRVQVAAADIGTGARTALTQLAAEALEVPPDRVRIEVGDSDLPFGVVAGGSAGTASWGTAVIRACQKLVESGDEAAEVDTSEELEHEAEVSRHGFGAQFVEARVNPRTGEIRVPRALGVFACGRILNPTLARSQFIGGMTMGLGMALLEEGIHDPRFGDVVNHDLAGYHVPTYADVGALEAVWLEEVDDRLGPTGTKGIGEIGIVGTAAAVASAVFNATGHRFRRLPIRLQDVLDALSA